MKQIKMNPELGFTLSEDTRESKKDVLNIFEKYFILIFLLIPIIDSINGFILLNNINFPISVGQAYRSLVILTLLIPIFFFSTKKDFYRLVLLALLLFIPQFLYFFNHNSIIGLKFDLSYIMKIAYIILIVEGYNAMYKKGKIDKRSIIIILKISMITFPLSIIIPKIFGVGFTAYGNGGGYSAFYNANNDINIVLIVLFIYSLDLFFQGINNKSLRMLHLIGFILMLLVTLLVGSKSSIFFCSLTLIIYIFRSIRFNSILKNLALFFSMFLILVILMRLSIFFTSEINGIIERNKYFLGNSDDLINYLLSNRDVFLENSYFLFTHSDNIVTRFLFGIGSYEKGLELGTIFNTGMKIVEMDFFDVFFAYGLLGTVVVYFYFINIYIKSKSNQNLILKRKSFVYRYIFISILMFSTIVGHVLFSALAGSYLALICCMLISKEKQHAE